MNERKKTGERNKEGERESARARKINKEVQGGGTRRIRSTKWRKHKKQKLIAHWHT